MLDEVTLESAGEGGAPRPRPSALQGAGRGAPAPPVDGIVASLIPGLGDDDDDAGDAAAAGADAGGGRSGAGAAGDAMTGADDRVRHTSKGGEAEV